MKKFHSTIILCVAVMFAMTFAVTNYALGASDEEINHKAGKALQKLYAKSVKAKALGETAKGILVFPDITKGGFMVGGQYGEGVLMENGVAKSYYNTISLSYGLQAGLQQYGYVLFFMTDAANAYLNKSDGWELGVGPNIVVVDVGAATSLSTTGLGLQGTKITKISK
jgi:lipid-binding SYLF domain-containing protein